MPLKFTLNGQNVAVPKHQNTYLLNYPCGEELHSCFPYESILPPGCYLFEVWGAAGGSYQSYYVAKGGYSKGSLCLLNETKAFFYTGAHGITALSTTITETAFNGGGKGKNHNHRFDASGGGASYIRLNEDSL